MTKPDRALRTMIGRLARLPAADLNMILGSLSEGERNRVLRLLAKLGGLQSLPSAPRFAPDALPEGLSPWLLACLGVSGEEVRPAPRAGRMTEFAVHALRECAAELDPAPPETPRSLRDRLAFWRAAGREAQR